MKVIDKSYTVLSHLIDYFVTAFHKTLVFVFKSIVFLLTASMELIGWFLAASYKALVFLLKPIFLLLVEIIDRLFIVPAR